MLGEARQRALPTRVKEVEEGEEGYAAKFSDTSLSPGGEEGINLIQFEGIESERLNKSSSKFSLSLNNFHHKDQQTISTLYIMHNQH